MRGARAALCPVLLLLASHAGAAEAPAAGPPRPAPGLRLGAALGALFPLAEGESTQPRVAVQLAAPLRALGAAPPARLEWLATAALRYTGQQRVDFEQRSERSTLGLELLPGARALLPVHARLDLSAELSLGLSLVRTSASTRGSAGSADVQHTHLGAVGRLALGGEVPLDERLRLHVEPVALQTWVDSTGGRAAWSMQFGLVWAL